MIALIAFFIVLLVAPVWAGDDHRGGDVAAGSDSVASVRDTSRTVGLGLGDVDIAQCYRSYSVIVWQDSRVNPICLADSLDAKGLHETAAKVRCDIRAIRKHFDSDAQCVAANTVQVQVVAMPEPENDDEEELRRQQAEEQQELYADLLAKIQNLEEAQNRPRVTREVVQQRVGLTEEQKAALREVAK